MKDISKIIIAFLMLGLVVIEACHHDEVKQYPNKQNEFAYDPNYRYGKWYSISDVGMTLPTYNARLDTIWFINDTLAGWTGFGGHPYVFWKTYIDPTSIYNLVYLAPNWDDSTKTDTVVHQFGFSPKGDTLTIWWDFTRQPPLTESYLKKKN